MKPQDDPETRIRELERPRADIAQTSELGTTPYISGVDNTVTITGHCASVTVSGVNNQVTVEGADTIAASGFDNRVTYRSGSPEVNNFGGSNVIEQG